MGKHLKIIFILLTLCLIGATEAQAAPTEYTEEQTQYNVSTGVYSGSWQRLGQKLAVSNRKVIKLGFWLSRSGSLTGDVTFEIRKVSDDSLICSKVWGDAGDIPTEATYEEVEFDTPQTINEEVYIAPTFSGGGFPNELCVWRQNQDVKDNECYTKYYQGNWEDVTTDDCAYRYTYELIEQQTEHNQDVSIKSTNAPMWGQKLTIPNRKVTKLAFIIFKVGNPTGDVSFRIYRVSNDELICSKVWGDASELPTEATWEEVTFDNPQIINEEVRIVKHHIGGASDNYVATRCQTTDVKNNEYITHGNVGSWYDNLTDWDDAYRYTYELIEQQTEHNSNLGTQYHLYSGQRLTISNRKVSKLAFWLKKQGNPVGDVFLQIRKVSDDSVIVSKKWGSATDLTTGVAELKEVEFDSPVLINEEVRILTYFDGTLSSSNYVITRYQNTDVKENEYATRGEPPNWLDYPDYDTAYRYTYTLPPITAPTVTTSPATSVEETTATLNGTLTDDGGEACQYQFEYDIDSEEPYASSTDWTGSVTTSQSFSEDISGLTPGTLYYFRAQAKNSAGTSSASELTFLTKPDAPTSFNATNPTDDSLDLTWAKGEGANKTLIKRSTSTYPTTTTEGLEVYFGTEASTTDTNLDPKTAYYYSAWSYAATGSLEQYSDDYSTTTETTLQQEYTEEQTDSDGDLRFKGDILRGAQRLTIANRKVTKLAFVLYKTGTPTGNITFTIRRASDDSLICSKVLGDASLLTTTPEWYEVTFDDPQVIDEEVRVCIEKSTGDSNNYVIARFQSTNVKADEYESYWVASWNDMTGRDFTYRYKYTEPTEYTEEQTQYNQEGGWETDHSWRVGQRLIIPNRKLTKLAFVLARDGTLPGDVTFTVRRVSDDTILISKVWGLFNDLPTTPDWCEVEFDTPTIVNDDVYILFEWSGGSTGHSMDDWWQAADVKANEVMYYCIDGTYTEYAGSDHTYRYTYTEPTEYIEQQTQYNATYIPGVTGIIRLGQYLTIPNRQVTKLGFWLKRQGAATGDVTFVIRRYSDKALIASAFAVNAADVPTTPTYYEVQFDLPPTINEKVIIHSEVNAATANVQVATHYQSPNVKVNEWGIRYRQGQWTEYEDWDTAYRYKYTLPPITAPTVATSPATSVGTTTATLNGEITDDGGEACQYRFEYDTNSGEPYASSTGWTGSVTTSQSFSAEISGLTLGTLYYFRAQAKNSAGTSSASELTFLTKPAAPTNVQATDGTHTDKVVVSWNAVTGATGYKIYNSLSEDWTDVGNVTSSEHTTSSALTITPGSTLASDGTSTDYINLSLSGASANNGSEVTYRVKAYNDTGEGTESETDTGYRGIGSLTYQWQRSAGDSDTDHSNISGATSSTYQDTEAPTYTVNAPTDVSVSAQSTSILRIAFSGASITEGEGRYYKCILNADGASQQTSSADRGYRDDSIAEANGYEVFSDTGAEGSYSTSEGATSTSPFDDTDLSPNARKYYKIRVKSTAGTWSNLSTVYDGKYTLANPPSNLLLTTDSPNQVVISWSTNNNPSGTEYFCENITQGTNSGWITGTSWIFSNLLPGTEYTFRVKARNGDEVSTSWTSEESLSTLSAGGAAPVLPPASITGSGNVSQNLGGQVSQTFKSGKIAKVVFPPFSIEGTVVTKIEPQVKAEVIKNNPLPQNTQIIGDLVADFKALSGAKEIESFKKEVTVTFTYTDQQVKEAKIDEKTLKIYWWDKSTSSWKPLKSNINTLTNTITALTSHFTLFALMGELVVEEEEVVEKPIEGMTIEEIKAKIREIQQKIIELLSQLIQIIQEEIIQLQTPLP